MLDGYALFGKSCFHRYCVKCIIVSLACQVLYRMEKKSERLITLDKIFMRLNIELRLMSREFELDGLINCPSLPLFSWDLQNFVFL